MILWSESAAGLQKIADGKAVMQVVWQVWVLFEKVETAECLLKYVCIVGRDNSFSFRGTAYSRQNGQRIHRMCMHGT